MCWDCQVRVLWTIVGVFNAAYAGGLYFGIRYRDTPVIVCASLGAAATACFWVPVVWYKWRLRGRAEEGWPLAPLERGAAGL